MKFTFLNNISIIAKTILHYTLSLQFKPLIKLIFIIPVLILNFIINYCFLLIDNLLFNYKKITIKKPFFIIGFPRSGTTFLHKMILKDNQFTTPKLWELIFAPSIIQKIIYNKLSNLFSNYKLLNKTNQIFRPLTHSLDNIHEINLNNPEEDYLFLIPYGGCFLLTLIFPIDDIWKLYNFDQNFSMQDRIKLLSKYESLIKRHLYYHGKEKTYLSKNPHFTCFLESLKIAFPDCNIIGCHRDPKKTLPSVMSSMEPGYRLMSRKISSDKNYFIHMYQEYFSVLKQNHLNNKNFMLLHMNDTKNNLVSTILKIYTKFKYQINNTSLIKIKAESSKSKKFKSQNTYSLQHFQLENINFDEKFNEYYSFLNKN